MKFFSKRFTGLILSFLLIINLFTPAIYAENGISVLKPVIAENTVQPAEIQAETTTPAAVAVPELANTKSDTDNIARTGNVKGALFVVDHFPSVLDKMTNGVKNGDNDDSWNAGRKDKDYWGIEFNANYGFNKLVYTTGNMFVNGGAFINDLRVQVRQGTEWIDIPSYISPEPPYNKAFTSYTFTFADTWGDAIRIYGTPELGEFTSISELEVYYTKQNIPQIIPISAKSGEERLNMDVGERKQLFTKVYDKDNKLISGIKFNWSSSDPEIVTVNSDGMITGKSLGRAVITAESEDRSLKCTSYINICKTDILPKNNTQGLYLMSEVSDGKFRFHYEGKEEPLSEITAKLSLYDGYDKIAYEAVKTYSAGEDGILNFDVPATITYAGYYTAKLSISKGTDELYSGTYKFGVVPGPHEGMRPDSFFSSNSYNTEYAYKLGIKVFRQHAAKSGEVNDDGGTIVKPQYWKPELDPKRTFTEDMFDYTYVDKRIEELKKYNISILGIVGYANPEWARTAEAQKYYQYGPPRDFDEFNNVTIPIIKRYHDAGVIKYVEFWNEPWIYGWTWADTGERFREFQNKWYNAAKAQIPDLKMVAGHSTSFSQDHLFIDKATVANMFADSSHPYVDNYLEGSSRTGKFLRASDYQVRNGNANGVTTHFITEDGFYYEGMDDKIIKDSANLIISHAVLANLAGVYMGNVLDGMSNSSGCMPGAVVYGVMTNFLEDRVPVADIWPKNELIYGAIFANKKFSSLDMPRAGEFSARWNVPVPEAYENDKTKVAVIWNVTGKDAHNLTAGTIAIDNKEDMKAYNMYGGPVGTVAGDKLVLPFSKDPVYILSDELSVKELNDIIKNGEIKEAQPVNMYFDLITSPLNSKDAKLAVTLQNQVNTGIKGSLTFTLPEGWELAENPVQFEVAAGELKKLELPIKKAVPNALNLYPVKAAAYVEGYGNVEYEQTVQVASAPEKTINFTGNISDFDGITPTTLDSRALKLGIDWTYYMLHPDEQTPAGIPDVYIETKAYTAYDDQYLYLGYAVNEPEFSHGHDGSLDSHGTMPYGWDAFNISVGFGERNKNSLRSADDPWAWKGSYRNMDYNYDLYKDKNGVDHLTRLRDPNSPYTVPYQTEDSAKYYPYVGEVNSAKVKITRDEANKLTLYQVALPLSEIGLTNGVKDPFRLGYVQYNNEGLGILEYSLATGTTFDYRSNTDSFSPSWSNLHELSTLIGFEKPEKAPVFADIGDQDVDEGKNLAFNVTATDKNGDALAYSASGLPEGASFDANTGSFSWKPGFDQAGSYTVTFTVSDGTLTDSTAVHIAVRNVAASELTADLTGYIKSMGIDSGKEKLLVKQLGNVASALEKGQYKLALTKLKVFMEQVKILSPEVLIEEQKEYILQSSLDVVLAVKADAQGKDKEWVDSKVNEITEKISKFKAGKISDDNYESVMSLIEELSGKMK